MHALIRFTAGMMVATLLGGAAQAADVADNAAPAPAYGIAAVVNDDIISTLDLENRLKFVLATTQLSDTPDVRDHLRPQLLRSLISERLQIQEATAQGIDVSDAELGQAVASIEADRHIPEGLLLKHLDELGVQRQTFLDQIRAQLMWTKLAYKKLRPQIKVSEDELDRERRKVLQPGNGSEVQIEVLALPVDKPENDPQVKALAERLMKEIQAGAPFESIARELRGAQAQAGDIKPFWAAIDQLDPALAKLLQDARPDTLLPPVRTGEGYTIVKLLGRRGSSAVASSVTEIMLKEILLKLKSDATKTDVDLMLGIGREVGKHPGTCSDPGIAGVNDLKDFDIQVDFRRDALENLPSALQGIVEKLPIGGVSEPYASEEGIRLFMLCEKVEKPSAMADHDETMQRLTQQKMELEAQKYLRNLRRDAFVDIRQ
jgi:peptidyl-prolyl cis-trans isomerase SurA